MTQANHPKNPKSNARSGSQARSFTTSTMTTKENIMEMTKEDYALAKQIPDMLHGFTIMTNYGDIYISEEDAKPLVMMLEEMTEKNSKATRGAAHRLEALQPALQPRRRTATNQRQRTSQHHDHDQYRSC
jgi:hypothetical protein